MKTSTHPLRAFLAVVTLSVCPVSFAVSPGQIDTFEDGTTQGWTVGLLGAAHPAPPINISSGGPAGLDDNFLLLRSIGLQGQPGGRLVGINITQWSGDYLTAGIGSIRLDLRNFGPSDLSLRLLFEDPTVGPPSNVAFSLDPVMLPAGGDWTAVTFPVSIAAMGTSMGDVETALRNATALRLYHSVLPTAPGGGVDAQLGVDNIQALGSGPVVPEARPSLVWVGIGAVWAWGRQRRRQGDRGPDGAVSPRATG